MKDFIVIKTRWGAKEKKIHCAKISTRMHFMLLVIPHISAGKGDGYIHPVPAG